MANGVTAVAAEAIQILGQIVVDRASQAAYELITKKAKKWLKCGDAAAKLKFKATCELLDNLRLQDLAMAPDRLRGALVKDALTFVDLIKARAFGTVAAREPARVLVASTDAQAAEQPEDDCAEAARTTITDARCTIKAALEDRIAPLLARMPSSIGGHEPELVVRELVDKGLKRIEDAANKKLCEVKDRRDRIVATAAAAFAVCRLGSPDCAIMEVVDQLDSKCSKPMAAHDRVHARSVAGHFWDAVTLKKGGQLADHEKRLVAALEGTFEVGCIYAVETIDDKPTDPFVCEVSDKHGGALAPVESLAIVRDVVIAGAMRDGTGVAAAVIRALVRGLPATDDKDQSRGMRLLSTITAYAATYTTGESDDAHDRRTALLESLTKDMTDRTDRDGDTIYSFGGSLRAAGGFRIGRKRRDAEMEAFRDDAAWGPLSLPLGFGIDHVWEGSRNGIHLEFGLLDLGQYLTWDKGGKVAEPDLEAAFSPSFTLALSRGRSLPFIVGLTVGYTPSYDFDPDDDTDKKGAWNIGLAVGCYVPLFDFN